MSTSSTHPARTSSIRRSLTAGVLSVLLSFVTFAGAAAHPAHSRLLSSAPNSSKPRTPMPYAAPNLPAASTPPTAALAPATVTPVPPIVAEAPPTALTASMSTLVAGLKVMNYYPAVNSWTNMWTNWDPATINADFGRIAALHANTVRIIIQADTFGYPVPQPIMQSHLAQIVSMAQSNGLKVQLTLFDWWGNYSDLAGSKQWASAVLAPLAGNSNIAFIELQNEMDVTNGAAMAWAQQMIPFVKSVDGGLPVTVSVYTGLQTLVNTLRATPPDFYDYHYYGSAALAYTDLQQAREIVAPAPLFIGETGMSSALSPTSGSGLPNTTPAREAYQDYFYRAVEHAAQSLGLPEVAPWVLSDFVPGTLTWESPTSREYDYGLFHTDGTAKPVAASVASAFGSALVDTSFNNGFENCTGGTPADWLLFHASQAQFACDPTVARSGAASARISDSTGDTSGVPAFYTSPVDAHVIAGQVYSASVWAKGANLSGTTDIALAWFDSNDNYLGTITSALLPVGATDWTQLTASGAAPAGAAYVQIHCQSAFNTGTAWFDDVTFQ